jgi:U6 snRNA-associated Sm-like protein LSm4
MNLILTDVIYTSQTGDKFYKMKEVYIRGSVVKYLRIPEQVIDNVKERASSGGYDRSGRGSRGGRGRGIFIFLFY